MEHLEPEEVIQADKPRNRLRIVRKPGAPANKLATRLHDLDITLNDVPLVLRELTLHADVHDGVVVAHLTIYPAEVEVDLAALISLAAIVEQNKHP